MKLKVKLFQPFSKIAGRNEVKVSPDRGNIVSLLNKLCGEYPGMKDEVFDKEGKVRDHLNIFINQVPVTSETEKTAVLRDGDEVMIMVAIAGG